MQWRNYSLAGSLKSFSKCLIIWSKAAVAKFGLKSHIKFGVKVREADQCFTTRNWFSQRIVRSPIETHPSGCEDKVGAKLKPLDSWDRKWREAEMQCAGIGGGIPTCTQDAWYTRTGGFWGCSFVIFVVVAVVLIPVLVTTQCIFF